MGVIKHNKTRGSQTRQQSKTGNTTHRRGFDKERQLTGGHRASMEHREKNQNTKNANIETKILEIINTDKIKVQ